MRQEEGVKKLCGEVKFVSKVYTKAKTCHVFFFCWLFASKRKRMRGEKPQEGWEMGEEKKAELEGSNTHREGRHVVVPPVLAGRRW
jgi:hypothetical protein